MTSRICPRDFPFFWFSDACVQRKIGKRAVEKRGLEWVLTSFINKAWGATEGEIEEIEREQKE